MGVSSRVFAGLIAACGIAGCAVDDVDVSARRVDAHAIGADAADGAAVQTVPVGAADGGGATPCVTAADCTGGDACTTARCNISGEIGVCEYTPRADGTPCGGSDACRATCRAGVCSTPDCSGRSDAGTTTTPPDGGGTPTDPIDPVCPGTCPYASSMRVYPPYVPLAPPSVPSTCANGFELGGANGGCGGATYSLRSGRAGGARAITLDVDFATYLVPDGVTITGVDATGARYTLLRTCRLQTWDQAGPSTRRPPDESIRQFRLAVRAGTTQLDFDFGAVTSPMYIRVLGLCDFTVASFANAAFWRAVP